MRLRVLLTLMFACVLWCSSFAITPAAEALTQIRLFDLAYEECASEYQGMLTSGSSMAAKCFLIKGSAENTSGKYVYDADVYGRIYDANRAPVMQNRTRVGSIDEVPPGLSEFEIRISVPSNQPLPLQLEQFKASGFAARVR